MPQPARFRNLNLARIYFSLVALRLCFALWGPGYIHPDEHYQNGEVISGRQLGVYAARTWEWDSSFPCRSITPPAITTGIPYAMAMVIWRKPENVDPTMMFHLERLSFFTASLLLDYSVFRIVSDPTDRILALITLASSYVTHTFQVRPFSNSIESILLALSLHAATSFADPSKLEKLRTFVPDLVNLAVFFVLGTFTRPTFLAFALPIAIKALMWTIHCASAAAAQSAKAFLPFWLRLVCVPATVALVYSLALTLVDTLYFRGNLSSLVFTPLNFLRYNLSSDNLAEHGVHPLWLHFTLNLPMLFGPSLLSCAALAGISLLQDPATANQDGGGKGVDNRQHIAKTSLWIIISSLGILSAIRHQEPRFLVPLLVPLIVLAATGRQLRRMGKSFWGPWIAMNVILAILFGILHQGGVVPSILHLHGRLHGLDQSLSAGHKSTAANVVYWKTYMPPWHLLALRVEDVSSGQYVLTDLAGAPSERMLDEAASIPAVETFLVTPLFAMQEVLEEHRRCFTIQERVFPHLDMDHLSEAMAVGWKDRLSLGVYSVDAACLRSEEPFSEDVLHESV